MAEALLEDAHRPHAPPAAAAGPSALDRARRFLKKRWRALPWVAVGLVAVAVGAFFLLRYLASYESTDDAQVDGDISAIGARIAGTVVAVHVEDEQRVNPGDLLVELDPADYRIALEQAEATHEQARFQLAQAKANSGIVQLDLSRARRLFSTGATPREDLDTHSATAAARGAELSAAQAGVKAAQAAVDRAQLDLDYAQIKAPVAGIVGQKAVNVGDRVQPAQELLALVQTDNLWITANFKETQLRRMTPGQVVDVHVDALDQTFRGRVESLPGASGARFSLLPPENATGNYVKVVQRLPVRIALDPGQPNLDRLRPGMSVEPKVWLR